VDEGTKKKIDKKVLRGYSVGVTPTAINRADEVEALDWVETSYVDRPKDPDAVFLYRTEGFDPDAEVEVEVLDDPATSAGTERTDAVPDAPATDSPGDLPAPDSAIAPIPSHSSLADPSGEELAPAAVSDNAAVGVSSPAEEDPQRAAIRAALVEQGFTPEAAERMAASVEVVAAERVLGAPVVGMTPNAVGEENATVEEVDKALGGGLPGDYRVEQAPTGMWCAYGPA